LVLFELGPVEKNDRWADYLKLGFEEKDVPDLLQLICDKSLRSDEAGTNETWVPMHAWRTLGQLRSAKAVSTLIVLFEHLPYHDWALKDLGTVLGMIGEPAIELLSIYMKESRKPDFARAMAYDGLVEVVRNHPHCRDRVLDSFRDYLAQPDTSCKSLNGYLVGRLLDLGAVELVDGIRHLFGSGCVDSTCAGGLKEVELELALRAKNRASLGRGKETRGYVSRESMGHDELLVRVDFYLEQYGNDESVTDASGLDGYLAAIACAPALIRSARWMPALWGGKDSLPQWKSNDEGKEFEKIVTTLNGAVMGSLDKSEYQALFRELDGAGLRRILVDRWCAGFLMGLQLWGLLGKVDRTIAKDVISPMRMFGTEAGVSKLRDMDHSDATSEQARIEPAVYELYRHFKSQRQKLYNDYVKNAVEVGRDEPCPCGSRRLYKNCCLHS